jgi:hypothetical protein
MADEPRHGTRRVSSMTQENTPVAPPDWVSKALATLDAISGYTCAALAVAAGLILFIPSPLLGIELGPIRKDWGGFIASAMIVLALLAIARSIRSIHSIISKALLARSAQRARDGRKAEVLAHLDALSEDERNFMAYCLKNNQRSTVGNTMHGTVAMLAAKGLMLATPGGPAFSPAKMPCIIPDFVWVELKKRKALFRYKEPPAGERGTGWMR